MDFFPTYIASGPRVASTFVKREAAISSLEKGGQWMLALELLAHAEAEGFSGFDMIRPGKESSHRITSAKYAVHNASHDAVKSVKHAMQNSVWYDVCLFLRPL